MSIDNHIFFVPRRPVRLTALGIAALLLAAPLNRSLGGAVPVGDPEQVGISAERLGRITEVVRRHVEAGNVAGVVTLVARKGRIVHFEAQGVMDLETGAPMRTDAIFRLASMTKPIIGVAVMMVVEEGEIRLTDPVSRFVPELRGLNKVAVPARDGAEGEFDLVDATREITVDDLLTHTSGLTSGNVGLRLVSDIAPRAPSDALATYVPKLAGLPLDFQPGTLWRYSRGGGFDTLARIVEVASGSPLDEFLRERLFEPLGMHDTGFYFDDERAARLPTMYAGTPDGLRPTTRPLSNVYFSGSGGLASSAEDYLQFAQMLLNGGELDGTRILGRRTIELMVANHTGDMVNGQFGRPERGMGFGLSVQVVLDPVAASLAVSKGAYGWAGGTGVNLWVEPREELVSIFMIQGGAGGELRRAFENAVRQAIIE